jgi:hypothetical protein
MSVPVLALASLLSVPVFGAEKAKRNHAHSQKRLAELSNITQSSVHNQVYGLQKPDFTREVTEASKSCFVCVNLTSSSSNNVESRRLSEIWRQLAAKYGDIKFCEMRGNMCIEGYPDRNTPTILVYKDGEIVKQYVTLMALKGAATRVEGMFSISSTTLILLLGDAN